MEAPLVQTIFALLWRLLRKCLLSERGAIEMSAPSYNSHEFAVRHFFGLPILMERWSEPAEFGGPGSWEWSRWHICKFAHCVYVNSKLLEMKK